MAKKPVRGWSQEEDDYLVFLGETLTAEEIAKQMPWRSFYSLRDRLARLRTAGGGMSYCHNHKAYGGTDIAGMNPIEREREIAKLYAEVGMNYRTAYPETVKPVEIRNGL